MPSARFLELRARETDLRATFLPRDFSETGDYDPSTRDRAAAYRVLMHAEIEDYIEHRAIEIYEAAWRMWKNNRKVSRALLFMAASIKKKLKGPQKAVGGAFFQDSILETAFGQAMARARANNGIKEKNLIDLLLPAGLLESDLDQTLLAAMSSFGENRGRTAHRSNAGGRVTQLIDPKSEYETVSQILLGLEPLDNKVSALAQEDVLLSFGMLDSLTSEVAGG